MLPAPVFNSPKSFSRAVAPPLPPVVGLSIFDDLLGDTVNDDERDNEIDNDHTGGDDHTDDVLKGELLRTPELIESGERSNSYYMVYSPRSKLVKIGITLYTYEECKEKYTKLYGSLESFHFLRIENDMTRERLERAFYQFFSETRMFTGKEFFHDVDTHGRDMLPVYLALLTILTGEDLQAIRRFYLQHGTTGLAARQWVESQHAAFAQGTVEITPSEAQALNTVHILSSETALSLSRADLNKPITPVKIGFQGWDSCESDDEPDQKEEDDEETLASTATGTEHLLAPLDSSISLYAAYSARAELVKIGFTAMGYEECAAKYQKVYGHLDDFYFLCVENDLLSRRATRLEKVFYRLFESTRIHPGQEFFRPLDDLHRPMLPLYVSILRALAAEDTEPMRRFYRAHRHPDDMQDWIEQQLTIYSPVSNTIKNVVPNSNSTGAVSGLLANPPLPKHIRIQHEQSTSSAPSTPTTQSASPHSSWNSAQGTYAALPVSVKTSSKAKVSQPAAPVPFSLPQPYDAVRRGSEDMV